MISQLNPGEVVRIAPFQTVAVEGGAAAVTGLNDQVNGVVDTLRGIQREAAETELTAAVGRCPLAEECDLRLLPRTRPSSAGQPTEAVFYCPAKKLGSQCGELEREAAETTAARISDSMRRISFWVSQEVKS